MKKMLLLMFFVLVGFAHEVGAMSKQFDKKTVANIEEFWAKYSRSIKANVFFEKKLSKKRSDVERIEKKLMIVNARDLVSEVALQEVCASGLEALNTDTRKNVGDYSTAINNIIVELMQRDLDLKKKEQELEIRATNIEDCLSISSEKQLLEDQNGLDEAKLQFEEDKLYWKNNIEERLGYIKNEYVKSRALYFEPFRQKQLMHMSSGEIAQLIRTDKMNRE